MEHVGSRLVVVMGHAGCGAVRAVREACGASLPALCHLHSGKVEILKPATPLAKTAHP